MHISIRVKKITLGYEIKPKIIWNKLCQRYSMWHRISRLGYLKISGWKKGAALLKGLIDKPTAVLNRVGTDRSAIVGYHRFLKNKSVNHGLMMKSHQEYLSASVSGEDLICIQDTTEYNYHHHSGLIGSDELGTISNGISLGLRVHPVLVTSAKDDFTYGLSSLQIINRQGQTQDKNERKYNTLPIEKKESKRWLQAIEDSKNCLSKANSLTFVSDRESDIFQLWSRVPDERTHLVIRCSFMRKFTDLENQTEITPDSALRVLGQTTIKLPARAEKRTKSREALLEISVGQVWTLKPVTLKQQKENRDPDRIALTMVAVKEIIPPGSTVTDPITWFLLTDLQVNDLQEALNVVNIYKKRWHIEQLFRLSKQKGFALEESQLERAHSLQNLIALVFIAAIRIYQMVSSRNNEERSGADLFDQNERDLLEKLSAGLEGRTERSKNKNKPHSLAYYLWIVARLGNWKPEDRDPPGPITFKRGWDALETYRRVAALSTNPN
jgi:hypothetical protein